MPIVQIGTSWLALTAGGLIFSYLLLNISWTEKQTMNQTLTEAFVRELNLPREVGAGFVLLTMISEVPCSWWPTSGIY